MIEIRNPGQLAAGIELDLARFRQAGALFELPPSLGELAAVLERVGAMLRDAEKRGQSVDLGDEVMQLITQFRGALRSLGGAPAEA